MVQTYKESSLEQKRSLLCLIYPLGLHWEENGYLNTQISPEYKQIMALNGPTISFGSPKGNRTPVSRMKT